MCPWGVRGAQTAEYNEDSKALVWTFRKVHGGSDHLLRAKVALTQERQSNVRKEARGAGRTPRLFLPCSSDPIHCSEKDQHPPDTRPSAQIGPVNINFSIPMYNLSRLQARPLAPLRLARLPQSPQRPVALPPFLPGAAACRAPARGGVGGSRPRVRTGRVRPHGYPPQVRYLQIVQKAKDETPFRWVRYITESSSYVCRI